MDLVIVIVVLTFVILGAVIGVVALLNRGKRLMCPECAHVFNAPVMEQKLMGFGWTFPFMGTVKCPKCGNSRARRDYNKVEP
jgi:endogenous inhibitor of DNA gyrase (YacG/DUF329 family)